MSKTINVGQPLFNNIEGHPFVLGPQGPYRTKEEARRALIAFYEGIDEIPNGQECIIAGVKFIWRGNDLYESLAVKIINESQTDLNVYRTPGTYRFNSIRNNNFANLPINNNNSNASITGELVVYSSVEGTTTYRSIIGQVLFLSNAEGHETKIYTRSANKTSKDGGATYEVTWGDWQVCQGMKEVGVVGSYDSFIDNGMYSGVYNNNGIIETFVIITINDYAIKSQLGASKSISQLKYALNAHSSKSELSVRVGKGEPLTWNDWKPVFDAESITTQITDIQNRLNTLTEGTTGNINDIVNKAVNDIVGGAPEAYDTLKEIVDYINKNKDEVTGQVTDIVTSINELQNLKVIDFGGNFKPDKIVSTIINHIKDNNIKHAVLFKYLDHDQSSVLGVCISRQINTDTNVPIGWVMYLMARKGIERLQFNSIGIREAWNEYGGILRHQQNDIGDGQLETMSINGLKSLIVDNLNANETLDNSRKLLSILSANQGRILNEKINTKHPILVPGTNIKNINGQSILGEGNIDIKPGITEEEKKALNDKIDSKAPKVGYAPDLKVNFAKELVGRGESTPEVIGGIRPTGVRSIRDGNATITKIKGDSVVWNQLAKPFQEANIRPTESNITYHGNDVTIVNWRQQRPFRFNLQLQKIIGHQLLLLLDYANTNADERLLVQFGAESPSMFYRGRIVRFFSNSKAYTGTYADYLTIYLAADSENTITLSTLCVFNLTQMFGAGNEPTTIEEFEARKPLGVINEYNEGTIVSYNGDALKSVGFNAFNGTYAKVIGGEEYHATGTTSISFAKELDGATTPITLDSNGKFTPTEDGYVYAEGTNIVIHLTHSYTPDHVDEYEEDVHPLPNISAIKDADGNQLFPRGLLSAGSVHDEITATKAIKRVGVVDMGARSWIYTADKYSKFSTKMPNDAVNYSQPIVPNMLNSLYQPQKNEVALLSDKNMWRAAQYIGIYDSSYTSASDFEQAMSGVLLYYELATPIEVDLPEPLNMTYEAWDFGTEELVAKGATTPLNADIVYQFNAVDRIRENSSAIDVLEEHVEERKDDGIELLDNGNLKLTLKGETREFMPATPSGDPMHYAYVSAGAEYNATDDYILKDAPWKDMVDTIEDKAKWGLDVVDASQVKQMTIKGVEYNYATENRTSPEGGTYLRYFLVGQGSNGVWVEDETKVLHLPMCWYLNGLGDITNAEMRRMLEEKEVKYRWDKQRGGQNIRSRTIIPVNTIANIDMIPLLATPYNIQCESICVTFIESFIAGEHARALSVSSIGTTNKTRYIQTCKNASGTPFANARVVSFIKLEKNCTMSDVRLLSKPSILYTIENATPTSAISITLHSDAYARLADDIDIIAALETKNAALEGAGGSVSLVSA